MKNLLVCLVVSLCVTIGFAQNSRAQSTGLKIGTVSSSYLDGTGCYFKSSSASKTYVFLADIYGNPKRAWLNVDGRITTLKFVSSTWKNNQKEKKGSRFTEIYRSGDITATVNYVVTSLGEIESTNYSVTIVVKKGNLSKTVKAVGECGS